MNPKGNAGSRHVVPSSGPRPYQPFVERQMALVAAGGGDRAAAKARTVGEILGRDFDFELLPAAEPLLGAGRETLRKAIESSLSRCGSDHRFFFYFAGQDRDLDLRWLLRTCLESACGEILIVADAPGAGRILRLPEYMPRLDPDRGPVQVVATAGPGEGETDLTCCLLDALAGRAGVHEDDGSLRFTGLKDYVTDDEDAAPRERPFVARELRTSPKGSVKGDFRFQRRWRYLTRDLVKDLKRGNEEVRLGALERLAELYEPPEKARHPDWLVHNLPLARWLVTRCLPAVPLEEATEQLRNAVMPGGRKLRVQAARTLGRLGTFSPAAEDRQARPPLVEALLHLAVRDRDGAVRFAAGRALRQALDRSEQHTAGLRLEGLRRGASLRLRSRLVRAAFWLPRWRRCLPVARRALACFVWIGLGLGWLWRWIFHHTWRRRLARAIPVLVGVLYAFLLPSYYLGTERLTEGLQKRNLVLRRGRPGFTALPGIGDDVVVTRYTVDDLTDFGVATEQRPIGSWLQWQDGALDWGHRLAAWLSPDEALLLYWRLGDRDGALAKLERDLAAGDARSIEAAVHMAGHDEVAFDGVVERLSRVAEEQNGAVAEAARRGLDSLLGVPTQQPSPSETAEEAATPVERRPVAASLPTLVAEIASDDAETRGEAVGSLVQLALDRRASAEAVEPYLREAIHDRQAWIRQEAAEGILLLGAGSGDVYEAAAEEYLDMVLDDRSYPYGLAGFTASFEQSTAAAAARFGNRLLSKLPGVERGGAYPYLEAFRALVRSQPEALPDVVPGLTEILTLPYEDQLVWETGEHLKKLRNEGGLDLAPLAQRFVDRLANGTDRERRAAAVVLGSLTEGSEELAVRVLGELERAMADPDVEVVARIGVSLLAIALRHEALWERATSLLLRGLADQRSPVRSVYAWSLSVVAEGGRPAPDPLPSVIWSALESSDRETRYRVARALRLWSAREAVSTRAGEIAARLSREAEVLVRVELAALLGNVAGEGPAVVDQVLPVFEAGLASGSEKPMQNSIWFLRGLAVRNPSLAGGIVTLLEDHRRQHSSLLQRLTVMAITDIGKAHPQGSEAALGALESILFEVGAGDTSDRSLWFSTIRALDSLGKTHPLEAPRILQILEGNRHQAEPRHIDFRRSSGRDSEELDAAHLWEVWVDLAIEPAAGDLDLLWEKLESRYSTHRLVAVELVRRLAAKRPELVPALRSGLEERRRDRRPHVRVAASEGAEQLPDSR